MSNDNELQHRRLMIELLLSQVFEPEHAPGLQPMTKEPMGQKTKIDRALGDTDDPAKRLGLDAALHAPKNPTADFYLSACPVPPLQRVRSLGDAFRNIKTLALAYSRLEYWRETTRLKITPDEVRDSSSFQRLSNKFTLRGIGLEVAGVDTHHMGRAGQRTCVSLSAHRL